MKKIIPLFLLLVIVTQACQQQQKGTIRFCSYFDVNTPCEGEFDTFEKGSRVWVFFELNEPSEGETLKGQLYFLENDKQTFVMEKDFVMNPGELYAMDFLLFNDKGKFLVVFKDSEGTKLAEKEIEIL